MAPYIEVWKPVPGFVGLYEVSDLGRVRSLDRVITKPSGRQARLAGKLLAPCPCSTFHQYCRVRLCDAAKGQRGWFYVHRLVLEAFVGPCPEGMVACHNSRRAGALELNTLANLRWDTRSANEADKVRHGTSIRGTSHPLAKLTPDKVRGIVRDRTALGLSLDALAARAGVTRGAIAAIFYGYSWSWLTGIPNRYAPPAQGAA
jgi:hypothetical protein